MVSEGAAVPESVLGSGNPAMVSEISEGAVVSESVLGSGNPAMVSEGDVGGGGKLRFISKQIRSVRVV